ncbi:MAG: phosphoglucosamine mutase [Proteobacteria bacterium]|nr:MAG: phosphoglucosamine mutase [Pseudomonadota bacterium]
MRKYFGTDGVRGKVGQFPITPDFALRLGYAAGKVLAAHGSKPAVIIGKDTRLSGYLFESALEAGFAYAGVDVYMAGPIPTPAIAYLTKTLRLSAGVVISASHNPYYDNGIKFFSANGNKLPDDIELEIEAAIDEEMIVAKTLGKVRRLNDACGRYIEFCKSTFPSHLDLKNLKIVLDCAHGATYYVAPHVFEELGAEVIRLACEPNGVNINNGCGSTHPEFLLDAVKQNSADYGIAFDGDGDRVVIIDKNGRIFNGDELIYIIAKAYEAIGNKLPGIVGTVMTNMGMEVALKSQSYQFVRSKVGDRYVVEELLKNNWLLGGEASGHILCLDKHTTGDGIISALQVLAAIVLLKQDAADVIDWQEYPQVMINVKLLDKTYDWQSKARTKIAEVEALLSNHGRVVVRASGTEPLVRVMVEAKELSQAQSLAELIADSIRG